METTDLLLYGLLAFIALLLAITILIMIRRHWPNRRTQKPPATTPTTLQGEVVEEWSASNGPSESEPLETYLQHLNAVCQSVRPRTENEYAVKLSAWSLPYTLELARNARYYDEPEDHQPILRLYFTRHDDGSWEISDRGETTSTLAEVSDTAEAEFEKFRRQIAKATIALAPDGTLRSRGENYLTFEQALLDMQETAEAMDQQWRPQVRETAGLMTATIEQASGERHEFTDNGLRNERQVSTEITKSFTLRTGPLVVSFEHTAPLSNAHGEGTVQLIRDIPGVFDRTITLAEFTGSTNVTHVYLVSHRRWRNMPADIRRPSPRPDIKYHLEIKAHGEWHCTILQPELGQSKGTFPHRAGLTSGSIIMGPFRTGPRPVLAQIKHEGNGQFQLQFTSLDGTHQLNVFKAEGQCHREDYPTKLKPGKEYVAYAYGSGPWEIELTEGY